MSRVTANINRAAPAMSAWSAGCLAEAFGIRPPVHQPVDPSELPPESVEKMVRLVHDAMIDNAIDGVDVVSAIDLWSDVSAPVHHIEAALRVMVERGYACRTKASCGKPHYMLCRTSAASAVVHVEPPPKPEKKSGKATSKKKPAADRRAKKGA